MSLFTDEDYEIGILLKTELILLCHNHTDNGVLTQNIGDCIQRVSKWTRKPPIRIGQIFRKVWNESPNDFVSRRLKVDFEEIYQKIIVPHYNFQLRIHSTKPLSFGRKDTENKSKNTTEIGEEPKKLVKKCASIANSYSSAASEEIRSFTPTEDATRDQIISRCASIANRYSEGAASSIQALIDRGSKLIQTDWERFAVLVEQAKDSK